MKGNDKIYCPCGCGQTLRESILEVVFFLDDEFKRKFGHELNLLSGIRCKNYNSKVGGSKNSAHILGIAADIESPTKKHTYSIVYNVMKTFNVKRIFLYESKKFIHIDLANSKIKLPDESGYYIDDILGNY